MAIYHLSVSSYNRGRGQSAVAAAAYRAREKLRDDRLGVTKDFRRCGEILHAEIFLPAGAPPEWNDRGRLWNAAEKAERRKDACVAREIRIALPCELTPANQIKLARELARRVADEHGVAADVAVHPAADDGDERNIHAHILIATRRAADFKKADEWNPGRGGPETVRRWRSEWAELANEFLANAETAERIDHRSNADRGIDAAPGVHRGRAATAELKSLIRLTVAAQARLADLLEMRARDDADAAALIFANDIADAAADAAAGLMRDAEQASAAAVAAFDREIADFAADAAFAEKKSRSEALQRARGGGREL